MPTLLYLHGIGQGDPGRSWLPPLEKTLTAMGFPSLEEVTVLSPIYTAHLKATSRAGVSDVRDAVPTATQAIDVSRYEQRMARLESLLGGSARGRRGEPPPHLSATALKLARLQLRQAKVYAENPHVRSQVLAQIQRLLLDVDELVVLGHSLGSVVARDVLFRIPDRIRVRGAITIGSPLPHSPFGAPRELGARYPYGLVESWVNIWNTNDPVSYGRGIAHRYPMVLDKGIDVGFVGSHFSATFARSEAVAMAVGDALFGSRERALVPIERSLAQVMQPHELQLVLRLTYGHLLAEHVTSKVRPRAEAAVTLVQDFMLEQLARSYAEARLAVPAALADARDGSRPHPLPRMSREDAVLPFLLLASANPFEPFEIAVDDKARRDALGDLAVTVGQTRDFGVEVHSCLVEARDAVRDSRGSWQRLAFGAAGVAILIGGPMAWAMAAPAGLAGGAAIASTLAALGPGGMIGGIMTLGTLASVGTGVAVTAILAESVESVEASVAQLLAGAIAADRFDLGGTSGVWATLCEMESELTTMLSHLTPYSDPDAASIRTLEEKRTAVQRAIQHLRVRKLVQLIDEPDRGDVNADAVDELLAIASTEESYGELGA